MEAIKTRQDLLKVAEVELIYRTKVKASERPQIKCTNDAYRILINHWDENKIELQEQFKVLFLNRANKVLGIYEVSSGGITGTLVDPRLIFGAALKATACYIIIAHSHPSGNLQPSGADKTLTEKIKRAGLFLDIGLLDHIILTKENYYSFADQGLL